MLDHLSDGRRRPRLSATAIALSAAAHAALVAWLVAGPELPGLGGGSAPSRVAVEEEREAARPSSISTGEVEGAEEGRTEDGEARAPRSPERPDDGDDAAAGVGGQERSGTGRGARPAAQSGEDGSGGAGRAADAGVDAPTSEADGSSSAAPPALLDLSRPEDVASAAVRPASDGDATEAEEPPSMEVRVGEPFAVRYVLPAGFAADSADVVPGGETLDDSTRAETRVRHATLRGEGLEVRPETPPLRLSDPGEATEWRWTVVPREAGTRRLRLEVAGVVPDTLGGAVRTLLARDTVLAVRPPEPPPLLRWLSDGWGVVAAVLLLAWLVRRRRRGGAPGRRGRSEYHLHRIDPPPVRSTVSPLQWMRLARRLPIRVVPSEHA